MVGEVLSLVGVMSVASLHHRDELRYSLHWTAAMDDTSPSGRSSWGVAIEFAVCVGEQQECLELCLEVDDEPGENFRSRLPGGPVLPVLWWVSAMDSLIRRK